MTNSDELPTSRLKDAIASPAVRLTLLVICLGVVGACWALASPIGASPDDDFHLGSIWCSSTAPDDQCVDIREQIVERLAQYSFLKSSGCQLPASPSIFSGVRTLPGRSKLRQLFRRSRANAGLYPDGYYQVMGLFVTDSPAQSVVAMKIHRVDSGLVVHGCSSGCRRISTSERVCAGSPRHYCSPWSVPVRVPTIRAAGLSLALAHSGAACTFMTTDRPRRIGWSAGVGAVSAAIALLAACRRRPLYRRYRGPSSPDLCSWLATCCS